MKLKVTKTMVKTLNKYAKDKPLTFFYNTTSPANYERFVDSDLFRNESDFDYNTGVFKYIEVIYPPDFYALPGTLTTNDLKRLYVSGDTVETFCNRVIENMTV